jgi:hypothetical protein
MTHTKDEALKLALEALEESKTNNDTMEFHDRKNKAITAIKQALAAQPAVPPEQLLALLQTASQELDKVIKVFEMAPPAAQPAPVARSVESVDYIPHGWPDWMKPQGITKGQP